MTIIEEQAGPVMVAAIIGRVDSLKAAELEERIKSLLDRGVPHLLLDCAQLEYINSAGLRVFLLAARQVSPAGTLAFCGLTPNVRLVFETIGFDRILSVFDSRETALAGIREGLAGA